MSADALVYRHLYQFSCEPNMGWPSKCGILFPSTSYRIRGVTCVPRLGITICRVLYFIGKCVFYSKKRYFWIKNENRQPWRRVLSHVSLNGSHIVVRLPSACRSCRSCNTKISKSRRNLYVTIYLLI
jgi:hypothetical protein